MANEGLKTIVHATVKAHRHLSHEKTAHARVHTAVLDTVASRFTSPLLGPDTKHRYLLLQPNGHTRKSLLK